MAVKADELVALQLRVSQIEEVMKEDEERRRKEGEERLAKMFTRIKEVEKEKEKEKRKTENGKPKQLRNLLHQRLFQSQLRLKERGQKITQNSLKPRSNKSKKKRKCF